jgi:hypothetical protein
MNRMNPPRQTWPIRLVTLLLLLGSGLAAAAEPVATSPAGTATIQPAADSAATGQTPHAEAIRLAWDRVGAVA